MSGESPPQTGLEAMAERLDDCALVDRPALERELERLRGERRDRRAFTRRLDALTRRIEQSTAVVERRRALAPVIRYDERLPIVAHLAEIREALARHRVLVICGATASGKSTQLPKICLEAGRGVAGLIGHTQPRRIAARAIAERVASEVGSRVGELVGYQVRFTDHTGPCCRLKLMTDGILLRELERDRQLRRYDTLIIDEAHERSLNIDFLLGVLKRLIVERADLRLIITSATIDPQRFSRFFGDAPVIEVSGRSYPVEVRYRPLMAEEAADELTLADGIVAAVRELDREPASLPGDILVFLPGERQIREAARALEEARLERTEILPLFARLSAREQVRVFEPHTLRRIVLATNVAETSLTVPGTRFIIDSGLARLSRYSPRSKVVRLPIEPVSQASAEQRKGRAGREGAGICVRLYAEEEFETRAAFTEPEVLRTSLASVILRMAALGLGDPLDFPFLDPPENRLVNDGYRLLEELEAVDDQRRITRLGRQIAALPVDPRLARMLIAAERHACLAEMLVVAAFLEVQDPRERPADSRTRADEAHGRFADPRSDFVAVLNLWAAYQSAASSRSGSQLRRWCREHFLSYVRMREWQDLQRQLTDALQELELKPVRAKGSYADLHQAILSGFLGTIGERAERRDYLGTRGTRFTLAPGTPVAKRPPRWIVAGSIIETTRPYARMVAAVEPRWIENVAGHLVRRSWAEPHWLAEKGYVAAFESASLYGLTLIARRRVNFASIDPGQARQIFVREALVEGNTHYSAPFLAANRRLCERIERIEARLRRRDVLVEPQVCCDFYLARLPPGLCSISALERWLRRAGPGVQGSLEMAESDVVQRAIPPSLASDYPDQLLLGSNSLPLSYRFEPGADDDGVTVTIPELLIEEADPDVLEWLVPGLLPEKILAMFRALPKERRRALVPIPNSARECLLEIPRHGSLAATIAAWLTRRTGSPMKAAEVSALRLPDYLKFNVQVVNEKGSVVQAGRDLVGLRRRFRRRPGERAASGSASAEQPVHRHWDFASLPESRQVRRGELTLTVYPTLVLTGDGVTPGVTGNRAEAEAGIRRGAVVLAILALPQQVKYARELCSRNREFVLLANQLAGGSRLVDALIDRVMEALVCPPGTQVPRSALEFASNLEAGRACFGETLERVLGQTLGVLRALRDARSRLAELEGPAFAMARSQIARQLAALAPADFPRRVPDPWFGHLPRYLAAAARRIDKLRANAARDAALAAQLAPFEQAIESLRSRARESGHSSPAVELLGWMLEEFRVSLFAQDLRTALPVSAKRLQEQLAVAHLEVGQFR